jgi:hypothetical protein
MFRIGDMLLNGKLSDYMKGETNRISLDNSVALIITKFSRKNIIIFMRLFSDFIVCSKKPSPKTLGFGLACN